MTCPLGRLIAAPGQGLIGVTTSKSLGCIARRAAFKRRGREAVRAAQDQVSTRLDYVLAIGESAKDRSFDEICSQVRQMFVTMKERWANELECS